MRNGISAVLIVKNEERVLERCLKTLEMTDEIVVLDTGSTDRTMEIARDYTSNVQEAPEPAILVGGKFHFAQARNLALSFARHDWILTIDADEICHGGCVEAIRKAFWKYGKATGFNVKFIVSNDGKDAASLPKFKVFRRGWWEWQYRIHEQLKPRRNPAVVVDLMDAVMEHLPVLDKSVRREQNLELLKVSVEESPEYLRNARQLGMELFSRDEFREALKWLELYLASGVGGPLDRSETMVHIARCHSGIGVVREAVKWFDRAIEEAPARREPHYFKALALIKESQLDMAIETLEACLAIPAAAQPDYYLNIQNCWDGTYPNEALEFCRAQIAEAKKKLEEKKRSSSV